MSIIVWTTLVLAGSVIVWIGNATASRVYFVIVERSWSSTDATVLSSETISRSQKSGRIWTPSWTYSYIVHGRRYVSQSSSTIYGYNATWYGSQELAKRAALSRPAGYTLPAYFDPADTSHSVLDRATWRGEDWITLALLLLLLASVAKGLQSFWRAHSKRDG
ncbi:DUF3592 domain-containing protein [Burkholderia cepacia]|uniref:DUF3592 domain-containing protein n=1 Tax=Burkholderia cepacia TaxID=292 RepID=UPI0039A698EA